jgi:hypothetical protein
MRTAERGCDREGKDDISQPVSPDDEDAIKRGDIVPGTL